MYIIYTTPGDEFRGEWHNGGGGRSVYRQARDFESCFGRYTDGTGDSVKKKK